MTVDVTTFAPADAALLEEALTPARATPVLRRLGLNADTCAATLLRYRPGRRALIRYDLQGESVVGKVRFKGLDRRTHALQEALWSVWEGEAVQVPEPIGLHAPWRMTLQRWVPGVPATEMVTEAISVAGRDPALLGARLAEAATKLHKSNIRPERHHTVTDELAVIETQLGRVAALRPTWQRRIARLLEAARGLAGSLPTAAPQTLIHRDFYPDQLKLDGARIYLLDLDLCCLGSPALDIGNFLAHLQEQALRCWGDIARLSDLEGALTARFLELNRAVGAHEIEVYTTLSLVRHIAISQRIPERRSLTEPLMRHCETRLSLEPATAWV